MMKSYLNKHQQAFQLSVSQFKRAKISSLLLILIIAIAFSLPIMLWVLSLNAKAITASWPHSTQLSVFLDELPSDKMKTVLNAVRAVPHVAFANYISPDEGLKTLEEQTGLEEVLTLLDNNPLPPVIEVHPTIFDENEINQLVLALKQIKGVSLVKMDLQWLLRLESMLDLAKKCASGLMILLCFVIILVVGNTIRLAVMNRKKEIEVLTLLGATNAYIRRPFLYFGSIYGFLGALLACFSLWMLMIYLQQGVSKIAKLYYTHFHLIWISWENGLMLLALGGCLGFLAAYISVSLQLGKTETEFGF